MGIKIFIYVLFAIALVSYYYNPKVDLGNENKEEKPLVTFDNSTMYTIDEKEVTRIVQSKIASIYEKKEELYDGLIIDRNKNNNEVFTDTMRANYLLKKKNDITLIGDVKYNRGDAISFSSEELYYNTDTMIGYNHKPFEINYKGQLLKGTNIYIDAKKNVFEAGKTHFELDMEKKDNNETK